MGLKFLLALLLVINIFCLSNGEETFPTIFYGILKIFQGDSISTLGAGEEYCFTYPNQYYDLPLIASQFYRLKNQTEINPCQTSIIADRNSSNEDFLLMRTFANCNLTDYVDFTKNSNNTAGLFLIATNINVLNDVNQNYSLNMLALITNETAEKIAVFVNSTPEPWFQFYQIESSNVFEGSIVLLWLVACVCVAIGSLFTPIQDLTTSSRQQILENPDGSQQDWKNVQLNFSTPLVLILVVFISGTLLLLYFFYDYLVYFFIVVFCIASGRATYEILNQLVNLCINGANLPRIRNCGVHQILLGLISAALPITWFILRHEPHIWILQDILGICFCIHLIQTLRIPNLKACTLLLSLLFFYDIFFVFITPFITSDGKSVMVEVATGGNSKESLPLLIKIPHLRSYIQSVCFQQGFSLLGFGDIIVPGFLVCFAHAFDTVLLKRGDRSDLKRPYFITAMIGYAIGLAFAFVVLYLSQTGQPALLYIVPSTLIPIYIVAACRKQVKDLWRGTISITEIEP